MNQKAKMYKLLIIVSILLIFGTLVMGCLMCFGNWHEYSYSTKIPAGVQFDRAMRTNNIDLFVDYAEAGLIYYEDYTGNPGWPISYDDTDWEIIKGDLIDVIATARIAANNSEIGSDAYEEALLSGQDSLSIIRESLEGTLTFEWFHPSKSWAIWAWFGMLLGLIISMLIFICKYNDNYY